jgi:VanZ family protein
MQDKIYHMMAYFVFGFLLVRANTKGEMAKFKTCAMVAIAIGSVFAVFDELHQMFIPGRTCDFFDATADIVGILLAQFAFWLLNKNARIRSSLIYTMVK